MTLSDKLTRDQVRDAIKANLTYSDVEPERRKAPPASGTTCPPAAWRRSTFGEVGLNCRVRNGIG